MIGLAEEAEEAGDRREWKDIGPAQLEPDALEAIDTAIVRFGRIVSGVDRAHRCADNEVRNDSSLRERGQHADLHGTEAAAAGQHECGDVLRRLWHGAMPYSRGLAF